MTSGTQPALTQALSLTVQRKGQGVQASPQCVLQHPPSPAWSCSDPWTPRCPPDRGNSKPVDRRASTVDVTALSPPERLRPELPLKLDETPSWCRLLGRRTLRWRPSRERLLGPRQAAPRTAQAVPRSAGPSAGSFRSPLRILVATRTLFEVEPLKPTQASGAIGRLDPGQSPRGCAGSRRAAIARWRLRYSGGGIVMDPASHEALPQP